MEKENDFSNLSAKTLTETQIECDCKGSHIFNGEIIYSSVEEGVKEALKKFATGQKAALFADSSAYLTLRGAIFRGAEAADCRIISVISDKGDNSVEQISGVFNLPEDVRCVITAGDAVNQAGQYFAHSRNIPMIVVPLTSALTDVFSKVTEVKINGQPKRIKTDVKKTAVIDYKTIGETDTAAEGFADAVAKSTALIDYRIRGRILNERVCKSGYNVARNAIKAAFDVMKVTISKRAEYLSEINLKLSFADYLCDGKLFSTSQEKLMAKLLPEKGYSFAEREFLSSAKLNETYRIYYGYNNQSLLSVPDYNLRAEAFSDLANIPETEILKGFIKCEAKKADEILGTYKERIYAETDGFYKLKDKISAVYYKLGGNKKLFYAYSSDELALSLHFASDYPDNFSTLTLLRDAGILEYLYK